MTGPEHFTAAERCLEVVSLLATKEISDNPDVVALNLQIAQVHATLALAAATAASQATAYDGDEMHQRSREWAGVT